LLHDHSKAWLEPLIRDYQFTFRRGFPEALHVVSSLLQPAHLDAVLRLHPIHELTVQLSYSQPNEDVSQLLKAENLGQLRVLTLEAGDNDWMGMAMEVFVNPIGLTGAEALAAAPQLAGLQRLVLEGHADMVPPARAVLQSAFGSRLQVG
jgi:hypothetical protein